MKFKSIDPYTEEVNWTYDSFPIGECKYQIENSRSAFLSWSSLSDEDTDIGPLAKKEFVNGLEKLLKVCNVEVFGPIAPIITARDENNAVEIANSTEYGLGAKIWYGNPKRAERLAKKIKSGFVLSTEYTGLTQDRLLEG